MIFNPEYVANLSEQERWKAYEAIKADLRKREIEPEEYQRLTTLAAKELEL